MREYIDIVYDGRKSSDFGGIQVSDDGGLFSEQFVAKKTILEEKIRGRDEPYFFGVEREPLSFPLSFYFEDNLSDEKKREIARWIDQDYYKPLYAVDNPGRIYYAMCVDDSQHIHNGIQMGVVQLNFRTNSPYAYSPVYENTYDFSENSTNGTDWIFRNDGDIECKPIIEFKLLEAGNFSIINLSKGGEEFKFTGLAKNEKVTVNCYNETISSDTLQPRYDNFNDNYLSFVTGDNHLKAYGKAIVTLKYQFKFK